MENSGVHQMKIALGYRKLCETTNVDLLIPLTNELFAFAITNHHFACVFELKLCFLRASVDWIMQFHQLLSEDCISNFELRPKINECVKKIVTILNTIFPISSNGRCCTSSEKQFKKHLQTLQRVISRRCDLWTEYAVKLKTAFSSLETSCSFKSYLDVYSGKSAKEHCPTLCNAYAPVYAGTLDELADDPIPFQLIRKGMLDELSNPDRDSLVQLESLSQTELFKRAYDACNMTELLKDVSKHFQLPVDMTTCLEQTTDPLFYSILPEWKDCLRQLCTLYTHWKPRRIGTINAHSPSLLTTDDDISLNASTNSPRRYLFNHADFDNFYGPESTPLPSPGKNHSVPPDQVNLHGIKLPRLRSSSAS